MEITTVNLQNKVLLNAVQINETTKTILKFLKVDEANLSIVFVSSQKIRALNRKFLKRNYATDVLAFDLLSRGGIYRGPKTIKVNRVVADIIICSDIAVKQAKAQKTTVAHELVLYVAHGILHLLGYEDDTKENSKRMREKEQTILKFLGKRIQRVVQ